MTCLGPRAVLLQCPPMSEQLSQLEDRVQRAVRRLRDLDAERQRLAAENTELRTRLRGLEAQIRERAAESEGSRIDPAELLSTLQAIGRDLRGDGATP